MKKLITIFTLASILILAGCGGTLHPGAVSAFDSQTAQTLSDTQNILEGLSAHTADYPKAVPAINQAREYYTIAKNDYLLWRCAVGAAAVMNNQPCPSGVKMTQAQVTSDLNKSGPAVQAAQSAATGGK